MAGLTARPVQRRNVSSCSADIGSANSAARNANHAAHVPRSRNQGATVGVGDGIEDADCAAAHSSLAK